MNDKLRLAPSNGGRVSDYTHVITPTFAKRDNTGYWKTEHDSSLEPPTYGNYEVSYLYTFRFYDTYISLEQHGGGGQDEDIEDNHSATLRYFGRFDTKELYDFGSVVDVTEIPHPFFKLSDVGVPIPIYISTTPPPMVIRSYYRLLGQRIATCLRRWRDAFKISLNLNTIGG